MVWWSDKLTPGIRVADILEEKRLLMSRAVVGTQETGLWRRRGGSSLTRRGLSKDLPSLPYIGHGGQSPQCSLAEQGGIAYVILIGRG